MTLVPNAPPPARRCWRVAFAAFVACAAASPSLGQPSPSAGPSRPGAAGTPPARPAASSDAGEPAPPDAGPTFGLLRPQDGAVAPLPAGTTYEDFLAWVAAKRGPGYGVNSVTLVARETGDARFEIKAEVRIVLHRQGEWVRVPLGFDEATLTDFEHEGPGACSFSREADEAGIAWSFDTAGEHTLRLTLLVPAVTRSDETRLALTTPVDAAVTNVRLGLPLEADVTAGNGIVRSATVTGGRTDVDWVGPGGRLDLAWRPKPVAADLDSLAVETTVLPGVNGKNVQLRVRQRIKAETGQISSVSVLLPDGYSLAEVTGALFRARREEPGEKGRVVTVELSEATAGPFEIVWQLTAPLQDDGLLTLTGFSLPGVPDGAQTGRVLIEPSAGYRIYAPPGAAAEGVMPLEMVEPESVPVAGAYEFRQPFRLQLKVEPVPAELRVTRKMTVAVAPDRLALDAELTADVPRGEVKELNLVWPAPDWAVSPIRGMNVTEAPRDATADTFKVRVTSPSPRLTVPLKASLSHDATAGVTTLPLPQMRGAEAGSKTTYGETTLCLQHSEDLSVRAEPGGAGTLRLQGEAAAASLGLPDLPAGERWTVYRATPDVAKISLHVKRLPVTVSAAVAVAVRPQGDRLLVEQRTDYDILHGSVSELRVRPPAGVAGIRFIDAAGKPLSPSPSRTAGEAAAASALSLDLGGPVTGPFSVTAEYRVAYPAAAAESTISVPLARPLETEIRSVSLRVSPPPNRQASLADSNWSRLPTAAGDDQVRWTAPAFDDSVSVRLVSRVDAKGPSVSRLLLRTVVDRQGTARTAADCRLDRPPRYVSLHFAEGVTPDRYVWRGQTIRGLSLPAAAGQAVELDLGPEPADGVLRVELRGKAADPPGFAEAASIPAFRFGGEVTVQQTLWQVTLPESQHLFTAPADYVPRFHWTLSRGLWTRQPTAPFSDLSAWFGGGLTDAGPEFEPGHRYLFSRLGPPRPLSFTVIARSLVVLIGAGAAIVLGYVFVNGLVPHRRLATAALAAALLLLWAFFPDQVQIFLQPAAFGLLLVSVAAIAERLLRRRQERLAPMTTSPSAVDFVTILPGENSTSAPEAPIGSEEPTVLRPGRTSAVEPVAAPRS